MKKIPARRVLKHAIKNYNKSFSKHFVYDNYLIAWKIADAELIKFLNLRGWTIDSTKINPLFCVGLVLSARVKNKTLNRLGKAAMKQGKFVDLNDLYLKATFGYDLRNVRFT